MTGAEDTSRTARIVCTARTTGSSTAARMRSGFNSSTSVTASTP